MYTKLYTALMAGQTVRISQRAHRILHDLASQRGESMQVILSEAIEAFRQKCFLERANEAFAALQNDAKDWRNELKERKEWEQTLRDDLEDE